MDVFILVFLKMHKFQSLFSASLCAGHVHAPDHGPDLAQGLVPAQDLTRMRMKMTT